MNHLIIYAHPNEESLNHHLMQTAIGRLQAKNHAIIVRNLYQLKFNPILSKEDINGQRKGIVEEDVQKEQDYIKWAQHITFIYPIWWTGMPAIMKGYIDRVFSYGFAYVYQQGVQKGLLVPKQATIINTQGKSKEAYESIGMDTALKLTSDHGIFAYCGLEISEHFFFDKADKTNDENIATWTTKIKEHFSKISFS